MLSRVAIFFFFAILAVATATTTVTVAGSPTATAIPANQCNTASIQCCNALQGSGSSVVSLLLNLLGIVIDGAEALVGITCTPISVLGLGQGDCSDKPVCCQNNDFNGLIAIGCVPININL
ncbi:hypothetical protein GALMADRAFT_252313 [Galerina marginata CBS 339.88]|uniref:Hydrophobin n=1 Tax=Galerina marginata (strain CBS 339.88) TaxID=685588 RepID=A0A067T1U4_GALM3|nr:hypothetical protein GALMADRAFT_252313 [Galerina marginata CBS 339.88]